MPWNPRQVCFCICLPLARGIWFNNIEYNTASQRDKKWGHFPLWHLQNIVNHIQRTVAILDDVFVSSLRYFGVTDMGRAPYPNTLDIMEKGINYTYRAYTVALMVWEIEVDVAADATKHVLKKFEHGFSVGVVAGNQNEVADRCYQLHFVGVPFKMRGKWSNSDIHYVLVLSISQLIHNGKFDSTVAYVREARKYGKFFINQVQTLFLAINVFQETNHPFPAVISK